MGSSTFFFSQHSGEAPLLAFQPTIVWCIRPTKDPYNRSLVQVRHGYGCVYVKCQHFNGRQRLELDPFQSYFLCQNSHWRLLPVTDRRGRQATGVSYASSWVPYTPERYVRGKWACCGGQSYQGIPCQDTDDVRVYRASSDKIAPGGIPAAWRLLTAWKSPQCVQVYKNVLEFGYRLALGA